MDSTLARPTLDATQTPQAQRRPAGSVPAPPTELVPLVDSDRWESSSDVTQHQRLAAPHYVARPQLSLPAKREPLAEPPPYNARPTEMTNRTIDCKIVPHDSAEIQGNPQRQGSLLSDHLGRLYELLDRDLTPEEIQSARQKPVGRRAKLIHDGAALGITRHKRHGPARTTKQLDGHPGFPALFTWLGINAATAGMASLVGAVIGFGASLRKTARSPDGARVDAICRELVAMDSAIKALAPPETKAPLEHLRTEVQAFVKQCDAHPSTRLRAAARRLDHDSDNVECEIGVRVRRLLSTIDKKMRLVEIAEDARWRSRQQGTGSRDSSRDSADT